MARQHIHIALGLIGIAAALGTLSASMAATSSASASALAATAKGKIVYTTGAKTVLVAQPGGAPVATLLVATPLQVVGTKGKDLHVTTVVWARQGSPKAVFADIGAIGSPIRTGTMVAALPKPDKIAPDPASGTIWQKVTLQGWAPAAATTANTKALWASGSTLYRNSCGVCHTLHGTTEFTALQWVGNVHAMASRTALTAPQVDLVLKYLQWHARDTDKTAGNALTAPQVSLLASYLQ